jgi:hypothetical protein
MGHTHENCETGGPGATRDIRIRKHCRLRRRRPAPGPVTAKVTSCSLNVSNDSVKDPNSKVA